MKKENTFHTTTNDLIKAVEKHLESDVFIIKDAAEWAYLQLTNTQVKLE